MSTFFSSSYFSSSYFYIIIALLSIRPNFSPPALLPPIRNPTATGLGFSSTLEDGTSSEFLGGSNYIISISSEPCGIIINSFNFISHLCLLIAN
jgi:hypothetical protein